MKKACFILVIFFLSHTGRAQIVDEIFNQDNTQIKRLVEQIAALKIYIEYIQKGYKIAQEGLTLIGDIKNKDFNMHKNYFASLKAINPSVSGYTRIADIAALQVSTLSAYRYSLSKIRDSDRFTDEELKYIQRVFERVINDMDNVLDELEMVTTKDKLTMKDDERIAMIDKLYGRSQANHTFIKNFGNGVMEMAVSRQREKDNTELVQALHEANN